VGQTAQYPAGYQTAMQQGGWPTTDQLAQTAPARGGTLALSALVVAALLSLGYALWALTARRGIFADFSAGRFVSSNHAKSSDATDTTILVVAGVVSLVALALWVVRRAADKTSGGGVDMSGLALSLVGVVTIAVGLFLSSKISDAAGQAAQGDKGVTATVVIGVGFLALAAGLLLGTFGVRGPRSAAAGAPAQARYQGYPGR
jgi:hypothetical protein